MIVKLLQWNIWYKEKIENILELIREHNPDIICLQELTLNASWNDDKDTTKFLAEELGMHYSFVPAHTYAEGNTTVNGIISRFPMNNIKKIIIQESSENNEGRAFISADIRINDKISIKVATTHLSYSHRFEMDKKRRDEADYILKIIGKPQEKFILTGDFNAAPNSYIVKEIEKVLKHCGPDYKIPTWTTKPFDFNGFFEDRLRWRIDYVFSTPDLKVLKSEPIDTFYSDHLPILVDFEI